MGMEFWSYDLRPWSHDLDLGILVDAPVSTRLICECGLPIMGNYSCVWNFGSVTFDHGAMTFDLGGMTDFGCL